MIVDTFMFRDEIDLLKCRLTELQNIPNLHHVIVEADVTHGGNKPRDFVFPDVRDEFSAWADRIVYVQAKNLPDSPDAWDREHAQREWCWEGLSRLDAQAGDIVLHGDLDEIPTEMVTRWVRPRGCFVRFQQSLYCFAIDWRHPDPWWGTVAGRVSDIRSFSGMRDARLSAGSSLVDAGWHFSWLGGPDEARKKMDAFCHPEVKDLGWYDRLDECYTTGRHIDRGSVGTPLIPVQVDSTYPKWMQAGHSPDSWYRP